MEKQLNRIEDKVNAMDDKLDSHLERIAKAETSIAWLKKGFFVLLTALGSTALFAAKHLIGE